jgi:hypothetical protein
MQKARSPRAIPARYAPCSFPHFGSNDEQVDDLPHPLLLVSAMGPFIMIPLMSARSY